MDFEKYKHKLPYPIKSSVAQGLQVNTRKMTLDEVLAKIDTWRSNIISHYNEMDIYKQKRAEYDAEENSIYEQFKKDLFKELGISRHPKAEALFKKAWDDGHHAGYEEVYACACNLVDLIR